MIKTEPGPVIIPGCAHRGVINTVYHAQKMTNVKGITMVLEGGHLIGTNEEQINLTIAALKELAGAEDRRISPYRNGGHDDNGQRVR